jgi:hypothetical protein
MNDELLVLAAKSGDTAAFVELVQEHFDIVRMNAGEFFHRFPTNVRIAGFTSMWTGFVNTCRRFSNYSHSASNELP